MTKRAETLIIEGRTIHHAMTASRRGWPTMAMRDGRDEGDDADDADDSGMLTEWRDDDEEGAEDEPADDGKSEARRTVPVLDQRDHLLRTEQS